MSPRSATSRSSSTSPRPGRRVPGQPKSTRQQYSVRCDLKDLPISASGQHPPCSNCSERGLKCVDEFAEVKAVKLLRRGRRLQQVEAVYGQHSGDESPLHAVAQPRSIIPRLRPEFFSSPFFHRFHIQRPILEPVEFCNRYYDFCKGNKDQMQAPGQLVALILVVWAASFGVNEAGVEELCDASMHPRRRRDRVNEMVHEVLSLVDIHGLLRKPSWDGVRALLLILPLTQEVQSPMERLAMYEATISQVHALCSLASISSVHSGQGEYVDALVRARIFWYAHVIDGVTSGLRGGRVLLTDEDLAAFETTLPPIGDSLSTPALYTFSYRYATIPIRVSSVCREIHAALTGPKARRGHAVHEDKLHAAWETLDQCWNDFDSVRQLGTDGFVNAEDVERFIDGWQIFIFECHNVIREALKQRLVARPAPDASLLPEVLPSVRSREHEADMRLHTKASHKCQSIVRQVVAILRRNLGTHFFHYDAALIRDGCFFAGFLLASDAGPSEDVDVCLQALREMRWAFAKSEDREQTVRMIWESRSAQARRGFTGSPTDELLRPSTGDQPYARRPLVRPISVPPLSLSLCTVPSPLGSASAPSTACGPGGGWPTTTPPSSSGTGMYDGSHRGSPTSPFTQSPHSALDVDGQVFYFQAYNYAVDDGPAGQTRISPLPSSQILPPPPPADFAAVPMFDASSVVFSNAAMGSQSACGELNAQAPAVGSESRHFGGSAFYQ
ncbi:hypothetical protein WOLCODRAFT_130794 [Wolfiporia cocos MD-104 SS10]|uniref:Zn(2)-C6 fungal-type domain-containing protein n=1 Tax=Wolfiporia cocos (strain MD-104) TaxID=742152 RepID=A0A2H3J9F5_WOLCO|nr:hypothetical protein WOLCODRAFT_130794 [Wolfiporia cocos MD-104 SS10]